MNMVDKRMLIIQSLDPQAHLEFSKHTLKWWVCTSIEVGGNGFLQGVNEQRPNPEAAVYALYEALTSVDEKHAYDDEQYKSHGKYLVTNASGKRRHWRWNGAAFEELIYSYLEGRKD